MSITPNYGHIKKPKELQQFLTKQLTLNKFLFSKFNNKSTSYAQVSI